MLDFSSKSRLYGILHPLGGDFDKIFTQTTDGRHRLKGAKHWLPGPPLVRRICEFVSQGTLPSGSIESRLKPDFKLDFKLFFQKRKKWAGKFTPS